MEKKTGQFCSVHSKLLPSLAISVSHLKTHLPHEEERVAGALDLGS